MLQKRSPAVSVQQRKLPQKTLAYLKPLVPPSKRPSRPERKKLAKCPIDPTPPCPPSPHLVKLLHQLDGAPQNQLSRHSSG